MSPAVSHFSISPHCSLTPRRAVVFYASLCVVTFAVAGLLTVRGFWPVLLYAVLEMAIVAWALSVSLGRRHHVESITIGESEVVVEVRDRRSAATAVFPRHWAQVKLRDGVSPSHPSQLTIESHGRRREIGSFLTEQERIDLARRLGRVIGRVGDSPRLDGDGQP